MLRYLYGITEAVVQRCSVKYVLLKISCNLQKNNCAGVFFLVKFNFIKKTLLQSYSSVNCKKFLKTHFSQA